MENKIIIRHLNKKLSIKEIALVFSYQDDRDSIENAVISLEDGGIAHDVSQNINELSENDRECIFNNWPY